MSSTEEFIARLPKAELHVHLEGSVEPETLLELARRHGSPLAAGGGKQLQELYTTRDFGAFLQAFRVVCELVQTPEDYELITYNALSRLARQNVRYAEVTLSAGVYAPLASEVDLPRWTLNSSITPPESRVSL